MIGVISIGCFFPFLSIVSNSLSASGGEDADLIGGMHNSGNVKR